MQTINGISGENLAATAKVLSVVLADEFILYTKTRNAHWNVEGEGFYANHLLFEKQYGELEQIIDEIAERIRSIGHFAPASLKKYLQLTRLSEESRQPNTGPGFIKELLADHESVIIHLRESIAPVDENYHDAGTGDYLTGLMKVHEKMAWMLRAHLK